MASSSNADNSFYKEVQLYPYPTHVNTANFLSIKLSGETNYRSWQEQMRCLLDSHDMLGFIDGYHSKRTREWERSDMLVKGWIFGSLNEDVMDTVVGLHTSQEVWKKLESNYSIEYKAQNKKRQYALQETVYSEFEDLKTKYRPLYEAIMNGYLQKAREYIIRDNDALTCGINDDDDSPLHVAIGTFQNIHFVEYLLKDMNSELLQTLFCKRRQNPLHRAALVGNTKAAKMLVKKNPNLLFTMDLEGHLPIFIAIHGSHVRTFLYLREVSLTNIALSQQDRLFNPFTGIHGTLLLQKIIRNGLFGKF